jgi:Neurochondrin
MPDSNSTHSDTSTYLKDAETALPLDQNARLDSVLQQLQQASTDEERLVALAILPRILRHDNQEMMLKAFDAIPWKFLNRLLISRDEGKLMAETGLHIWAAFTPLPMLQSRSELLKRIPACARLIADVDDELKVLILRGFIELSQTIEGCASLANQGVFDALNLILKGDNDALIALVLALLQILSDRISSSKSNVNLINLFILPLANIAKCSQSAVKFQAIELAVKMLCMESVLTSNTRTPHL